MRSFERIAEGLALPDEARLRLGLAPRGGLLDVHGSGKEDTANRRSAFTLAVGESAAPADRSPKREAIARIDLGIALAHLGSLEEAVAQGSQALSSVRGVDSVLLRADELDRALMTCFPQEAIAQSFHEQYRQMTRHANEHE